MLRDDVSEMPKNWNRRFKHNRDKIKTGDIYELAEVVRNLAIREHEKGLSTGEKQMFTRAKKILASELMYALDKDEDEAEAYLDDLLARRRRRAGARAVAGGTRERPERVAVALLVAAGAWRAPWCRRAQGVRRAGGPSDARVVARRAARRRGGRGVVVALPPGVERAPTGCRRVRGGGDALGSRCATRWRRAGRRRASSSTTRRARWSTPELLDALRSSALEHGAATRRSPPRR